MSFEHYVSTDIVEINHQSDSPLYYVHSYSVTIESDPASINDVTDTIDMQGELVTAIFDADGTILQRYNNTFSAWNNFTVDNDAEYGFVMDTTGHMDQQFDFITADGDLLPIDFTVDFVAQNYDFDGPVAYTYSFDTADGGQAQFDLYNFSAFDQDIMACNPEDVVVNEVTDQYGVFEDINFVDANDGTDLSALVPTELLAHLLDNCGDCMPQELAADFNQLYTNLTATEYNVLDLEYSDVILDDGVAMEQGPDALTASIQAFLNDLDAPAAKVIPDSGTPDIDGHCGTDTVVMMSSAGLDDMAAATNVDVA